jgi:hypothetical protein
MGDKDTVSLSPCALDIETLNGAMRLSAVGSKRT